MTATVLSFCNQFKQTLVKRDAAFYWGPAAKGVAVFADTHFKTNFYPTVRAFVSDANALSGSTYVVDAVNAGRRGYKNGRLIEWIGALFFATSATEVSDIACEMGHCRGATESATVEFVDTVGDLAKAVWTWDRVQEIRDSDYAKGAEGSQKSLADSRRGIDLTRYTIWTVSAMSTVILSYLSSQNNYFAKVAGVVAEDYALPLIVNGVRGALGLASFIIGLNLAGRAPVRGQQGQYQDIAAARRAMGAQDVRDAVKNNSEFTSIWDKMQHIVNDRKKTRSASKVVRLGLLAAENLSIAAGWSGVASSAASFSGWLKEKQTFCKVVAVPGWISTGFKNYHRHLNPDAASAKAWLDWGFVFGYDVCAVPTYLYGRAGVEFSENTKWFLKEATRHWCALFQAAALLIEFGYNVDSKKWGSGDRAGARERFMDGARALGNGTSMDEAHWRDTLYLVDRVSVAAMTALTLYRWACDVRSEKFASYGSLILLFDAAKAWAGLAKDLWEDRDSSGFIEKQAEAYLKEYGAAAA